MELDIEKLASISVKQIYNEFVKYYGLIDNGANEAVWEGIDSCDYYVITCSPGTNQIWVTKQICMNEKTNKITCYDTIFFNIDSFNILKMKKHLDKLYKKYRFYREQIKLNQINGMF